MSTSVHDGTVLYDPAEVGSDRLCDTGIIRDGVYNSAMHKADSAAQVRAAFLAPAGALWLVDNDPFLGTTWAAAAFFHEFPLAVGYAPKVRANGAGYRLRIWLAGRSSAGHDCDFVVVVVPRLLATRRVLLDHSSWPNKAYSDITSTTVAKLTADDANDYLDIPQSVIDQALGLESWSTLEDTGGNRIGVQVPALELVVRARTANVSSVPEVHGLVVAEVIGDT